MSESLRVVGFESTFPLSSGTFRVRADFTVASGERVALFSPSGSGKSTLLRWIAGIGDRAAKGSVFSGTREITKVPPEQREIGLVFQDYALFPTLTVAENIAFGLEMRGASLAERNAKAAEWMDRLHLAGRAKVSVGLLSGGEKQRVALARSLAWGPQILLLDEPFSALDLATRKKARSVVKTLLEKSPVPTIFVTHDPEDVAAIATRTFEYSVTDEGMTHTFGRR